MTQRPRQTFTLAALSERAGVTPRTVRYYIAQGLLPAPGSGSRARYDGRHIGRLQLVRELQRQHLPLAEIRARLETLDDEQVDQLLTQARRPAPPPGSAVDYIRRVLEPEATYRRPSQPEDPSATTRSQWERLSLSPDIELHIRRPSSRHQNRQVERLVAFARQLLEGESR